MPEDIPFQRLLKNNDLGIIENPLRRIDEEDLEEDIRKFHKEESLADLVDLAVLIRGGLLARDEEGFIAEHALSEPEANALNHEKKARIWEESKELRIILLTCIVASVVQGWAQGAIVGANQGWPSEFGLITGLSGSGDFQADTERDVWRFSATNAIVYFAASTIGAFLCDPLTELLWGRQGALFAAAAMTFAASVGAAFTHSWQGLFASRVILGVSMRLVRRTLDSLFLGVSTYAHIPHLGSTWKLLSMSLPSTLS